MDGRQPVAELVRDTGSHLAKPGQGFFQSQLLFELDDRREVGEQTDHPAGRSFALAEARRRDTHVRHIAGLRHFECTTHDRLPGRQTFADHPGKRDGCVRKRADMRPLDAVGEAEHLAAGRIDNLYEALSIDNEETRRETVDDLRAERLRGLGPLGHGALLGAQFLNPFLEGDGQQRRLSRVPKSMTRISGGGNEPEERPGHDRDEHRGQCGHPEQRVGLRVHW